MMEKHYDLPDAEFERSFADCSLHPSIFSHEAHLRLAWIYINKYGLEAAEKNIQTQLQHYVKFNGGEDKYNKTLTAAAVMIVNYFMKQSDFATFSDFILNVPQLKTNFKELVASHYSFDIFTSKKAKEKYLEPDLAPFE